MLKRFFGDVPHEDWMAVLAIAGYTSAIIIVGLYGALVRWIATN